MWKLVRRSLLRHKVRTLLTICSIAVAIFLLCFLRSLVTTLTAGVAVAERQRLWVQSAVSLFVDFPVAYQSKIEAVDGVRRTCKFQWFGGYFRDRENFFAQFAVDAPVLLEMWPEARIVSGSKEAFLADRRACIIGNGLAKQFGWKVGDTVPISGVIFQKKDRSAWEFQVAAIYEPAKATLDNRTLYFHWDLFEKTLEDETGESPSVGVIVIETEPGANQTAVMTTVDGMFENGPQVVRTTTEAEFSRQFVSMVGNVPRLVSYLGGGVLLAILLACVNTMLMQAREQLREIGVMKALGFGDGATALLLLLQAMLLVGAGGGLGIGIAYLSTDAIGTMLGANLPGYKVADETLAAAVGAIVLLGLLAGAVPARMAERVKTAEAMRPH